MPRSLLCLLLLTTAAGADDVKAFRARPLAEKLRSPRATLETLCFAMDAYDRIPELIADAVACLDLGDAADIKPGTAELLAIQLNEIIDELSFPFESVGRGADGKPVVFVSERDVRIELSQGKDKLWRFGPETIARIPAMRQALVARAKLRNAARAQLGEGLEDPTTTMTTFLDHATAGDYHSAAARLDLSGVPPSRRGTLGPLLAWKLSCVMQRRGYLYRQSVPFEADGPPFTWSADAGGRIMVERLRQPGGKDAWLFGRATVDIIDKLWERDKGKPIDPRYVLLKAVVPPAPDGLDSGPGGAAPESVPPEFASPRAMVRAFFRLMDEAEYHDEKLAEAAGFLDLAHLAAADVDLSGPKLASALESVLRKIRPDLGRVSDRWSAPPQVMSGPNGLRVEVVRGADGRWRFSADTAARLPTMYESVGARDRAADDRAHGQGTPRETLLTFLRAVNQGHDSAAAKCLDLSEMPPSARRNLGPVLAFKLKSVLDRTGRIYLQEVPNDAEGPRFVVYRGPEGRVALARDDESKSWRFTAATVAQIEAMFDRVLDKPVDPSLAASSRFRLGPSFWKEPGVWIRSRVPAALRVPFAGLPRYQWGGLVVVVLAAGLLAWAAGRAARPLLRRWLDPRAGSVSDGVCPPSLALPAPEDPTRGHLGSLRLLVFLGALYVLLQWLDLPAAVAGQVYSAEKLVLTLALLWAAFQATDVAFLHYGGRLRSTRRGLADLIAPFSARLMKLAAFLFGLTYLVYEFGQADALKQFLAGLGLLGIAVSLAAQDSLKDLFATMLLISDRTFRVGDRLVVGDKEGIVEAVGFRSTKLRTPDDSLITLPNSLLANGAVDNLGLRKSVRLRLPFSVAPTTPEERVKKLCDDLRAYLASRLDVDASRSDARLTGINELGVAVEVEAFVEADDRHAENRCRAEITFEIVRLGRANEVEVRGVKK